MEYGLHAGGKAHRAEGVGELVSHGEQIVRPFVDSNKSPSHDKIQRLER